MGGKIIYFIIKVDQLPITIAPNLITIAGFCNLLTGFALILVLNPMFD